MVNNENFLLWIWLATVSFVGGVVGYINRTDTSGLNTKQRVKMLSCGVITSMFIAYITYEIALYALHKDTLAVAIAGLASYMGTNTLVAFENAFLEFVKNRLK